MISKVLRNIFFAVIFAVKISNSLWCFDSNIAWHYYNGKNYTTVKCHETKTKCWKKKYLPPGKSKVWVKKNETTSLLPLS